MWTRLSVFFSRHRLLIFHTLFAIWGLVLTLTAWYLTTAVLTINRILMDHPALPVPRLY